MRMRMLTAMREVPVSARYPLLVLTFALTTLPAFADWQIYGQNAQHSSQSNVRGRPVTAVLLEHTVDNHPQ